MYVGLLCRGTTKKFEKHRFAILHWNYVCLSPWVVNPSRVRTVLTPLALIFNEVCSRIKSLLSGISYFSKKQGWGEIVEHVNSQEEVRDRVTGGFPETTCVTHSGPPHWSSMSRGPVESCLGQLRGGSAEGNSCAPGQACVRDSAIVSGGRQLSIAFGALSPTTWDCEMALMQPG